MKNSKGHLVRTLLGALLVGGAMTALVGAGLAQAAVFGKPYTVPLIQLVHNPSGFTAKTAPVGHQAAGSCDSIPATEDGWHFVAPNAATAFISLNLTFKGQKGSPTIILAHNGMQAFVGTTRGAKLVSPTNATVHTRIGRKHIKFFTLSNTCPGKPGHVHHRRHHHHHHHHHHGHRHHHHHPTPAPTPSPVPTTVPVTG